MKENDPIKNLTEATPEGHPARAPERHPSKETPARMPLDGRIEKRVPRDVHVRLVLNEPLLIAEKAVTVNVSPHGAPLVTRRFWRAEEHPWLPPLTSDIRQRVRVVYCLPSTGDISAWVLNFARALRIGEIISGASDLQVRLLPVHLFGKVCASRFKSLPHPLVLFRIFSTKSR